MLKCYALQEAFGHHIPLRVAQMEHTHSEFTYFFPFLFPRIFDCLSLRAAQMEHILQFIVHIILCAFQPSPFSVPKEKKRPSNRSDFQYRKEKRPGPPHFQHQKENCFSPSIFSNQNKKNFKPRVKESIPKHFSLADL